MHIKPIFRGTVVMGKLRLNERQKFNDYVSTLNGEVEVVVGKAKKWKDRSNQENRYYWGVVVQILSDHIGYQKDEMHDALKWKFLRKEGKIPTVKSTANLDTMEFEDYLERIRVWAAVDMNVRLPLPNEIDIDNLELNEN